jgi:hypothetical protein
MALKDQGFYHYYVYLYVAITNKYDNIYIVIFIKLFNQINNHIIITGNMANSAVYYY